MSDQARRVVPNLTDEAAPMAMTCKTLGRSPLCASELCLGCTTFGTHWGAIGPDRSESRRIFDAFVDAGGNFFDAANRWEEGLAEQFLGEFIAPARDRYVIATHYALLEGSALPGPHVGVQLRAAVRRVVESSLRQLRTDYIDLLWTHIYDFTAPLEEIQRALEDLIDQGKLRAVGAANFPAWWLARANATAALQGYPPFIATQLDYSIVERSGELEFLAGDQENQVAVVASSSLAGGICTGKYNRGGLALPEPAELHGNADSEKHHYWQETSTRQLRIMDDVVRIAAELGRPASQVALRFLLDQPIDVFPIFAARTVEQARENIAACDFRLTPEELARLAAASRPALGAIMPGVGAYPHLLPEFGGLADADFYSRYLLRRGFGDPGRVGETGTLDFTAPTKPASI